MDIFVIEIKDADNVHLELLKEFQKKEISDPVKWNQHCFSYLMLDRVLREFYKIEDRTIVFDGNKPILNSGEKCFSISHSGKYAVLVFSDCNCGVDIEQIVSRDYEKIAARMKFSCNSLEEFYKCWTKFEAEYKLGETAQKEEYYKIEDYYLTVVSSKPDEEFNLWLDSAN